MNLMKMLVYFHWAVAMLAALIASCCFAATFDEANVAYQAGDGFTAHIEPVGVGDALPDMPLFLTPNEHILVPLESTYAATWAVCPEPIRELVEEYNPDRR